jgi:hypothetical protein
MAKIFYTERDIDELHARGVTSLDIHDGVVLTDLARERMEKYGMVPNRINPNAHPEDNPDEILVHRIKAAVLARLNGNVDPVLLDKVVRRVLAEMK